MRVRLVVLATSAVVMIAGCGSASRVQPLGTNESTEAAMVADSSTAPRQTTTDASTNEVASSNSVSSDAAAAGVVLSAVGYDPIDFRTDIVAAPALCCPGGIRVFIRADGTTIKASASDISLGEFSDIQPIEIADASAHWSLVNFSEGTGIVVVSRAASSDEAAALTASVSKDFSLGGLGGLSAPSGFTESTGQHVQAPSLGTTIEFASQSDRIRIHFAPVPDGAQIERYDVPGAWTTQRGNRVLSIDTISSANGTTTVQWVEAGLLVQLSDRSGLEHALKLVDQIRPITASELGEVRTAVDRHSSEAPLVAEFKIDNTNYQWHSDGQSPGWICRQAPQGAECIALEYSNPSVAVFPDPVPTIVGIEDPGIVTTIDSAEVSTHCDELRCWFVAQSVGRQFKIHGQRPTSGGADVTLDAEVVLS